MHNEAQPAGAFSASDASRKSDDAAGDRPAVRESDSTKSVAAMKARKQISGERTRTIALPGSLPRRAGHYDGYT
jgi:hypothetical protein